jgi:hypothetical protein
MKQFLWTISCILLVACNNQIPTAAYQTRGQPESLLDISTEVINLSVESGQSLDQLIEWLNEDQPTRAELYCDMNDDICMQAKDIMDHFGIVYHAYADTQYRVTLLYDRVLARDCDSRHIANPHNPYNFNHPTFGCSIAANSVQMVSDKQQIAAPKLSDFQDAAKMEQPVKAYYVPPQDINIQQSLTN